MTRPPRWWCREPGSNWRHRDFQSRALPTELSRPDGQPGFGRPSAGPRIPRGRNRLQGEVALRWARRRRLQHLHEFDAMEPWREARGAESVDVLQALHGLASRGPDRM